MDDPSSHQKNKLQTEEKILLAAKKVFIEKGFDGASTSDIARAAGVNKALLHYYFRSKEKLFQQVFRQCIIELWEKSFSILGQPIDLFDKIKLFINKTTEAYLSAPRTLNFVMYEITKWDNSMASLFSDELEKIFLPNVEVFYKQVEQEARKGTIKPVDPFSLLLDIVSLIQLPLTHGLIILNLNTYHNIKDPYTFFKERAQHTAESIIHCLRSDC